MPKTREQKEQIVADLTDKIGKTRSVVFTSISGFSMDDANALRAKGREQGVELTVAKKTLLLRALEQAGYDISKEQLEGSVLTSLGYNDAVAPAKLMAEYIKEKEDEQVYFVGGLLEGVFVGRDAITQLATLPSREELLAKMVGSIKAPISGFTNVLAGNLRGLVNVLNAVKDTKEA